MSFDVAKTAVGVDPGIAPAAVSILGTGTIRATIGAALREVVNAQRAGRFDFDAVAWGGE